MTELIRKIQTLTESELQTVMNAIEAWYTERFPQWEVLYIAVHKDPAIRKQELEQIYAYLIAER